MKTTYPLVSCIFVTNNRPVLLQRAIAYLEAQNYLNKELLTSYPINDLLTREVIVKASKNEVLKILALERSSEESLSNARNISIDKCNWDYIYVWYDDWYHANRLSLQFNSMQTLG